MYAEVASASVASGAIVPVFQSEATTPTSSSVVSGSVLLTSGVYLVTYGYNATGLAADEEVSISLYSNGTPLANGELTQSGGVEVSASKTILYSL